MRSVLRPRIYRSIVLAALVVICAPACAAGPAGANAEEAPFLSDNEKAMTKMMNDMSIQPTGDVDRDFVAMRLALGQSAPASGSAPMPTMSPANHMNMQKEPR